MSLPEEISLLDHAITYAKDGWAVLPVHSPEGSGCSCGKPACSRVGKHPRTKNGVKDASSVLAQIRHWWTEWPNANIGLATGRVSGRVVLDQDGPEGRQSMISLLKEGRLPKTRCSFTGRIDSNRKRVGRHWIVRIPADAKIGNNSKLGKGLDVQGDGKYIVAPPSLHKSGLRYKWKTPTRKIADAPKWLIERLKAPKLKDAKTKAPAYHAPWLPEIPALSESRPPKKGGFSAQDSSTDKKACNELSYLNVDPIKSLHRHDGFVAFAVKGDEWKAVKAIRATALDTVFPQVRKQLEFDSYVSINATYRHARGIDGDSGKPRHTGENLRFLCACFADIDYYRKGLDLVTTLKMIMEHCEKADIPPVSCVVDTGRGIWLLWPLRDDNDPARAHCGAWADNPSNHRLLQAGINRTIQQRLAYIGADPRATDGTKHIRIPGSRRSDNGAEVKWWMRFDGAFPLGYTLNELGRFFGIGTPDLSLPGKRLGQNVSKKKNSWVAMMRNFLTAFQTLLALRGGGFSEGYRNQAALIYATILKLNGFSRIASNDALRKMAALCEPQLSEEECRSAIYSAYKSNMFKRTYESIADLLEVTREEANVISRAIGKPFPASSAFGPNNTRSRVTDRESRADKRAVRRSAIKKILRRSLKEKPLSLRDLQSILHRNGIDACPATIAVDIRSMDGDLS